MAQKGNGKWVRRSLGERGALLSRVIYRLPERSSALRRTLSRPLDAHRAGAGTERGRCLSNIGFPADFLASAIAPLGRKHGLQGL